MGFSLVAGSGDYSLVARRRLFIVVASRVVEHRALGLQASGVEVHGLSCPATCGIFLDQGPPAFLTWATTEVSHMYSYPQGWIVFCGPDPNSVWKNFFKKII